MSIRDLVPKLKGNKEKGLRPREDNLFEFQRGVNRLFDEFFGGFGLAPAWPRDEEHAVGIFNPRLNVAETDKEITVTAELPGMDEKDVKVELDDNCLVVKGEKKEQHEEKHKSWHGVEQSYGSFHRMISLPTAVDGTQTKAKLKKGVLTVTLQKVEDEKAKRKTIDIQAE